MPQNHGNGQQGIFIDAETLRAFVHTSEIIHAQAAAVRMMLSKLIQDGTPDPNELQIVHDVAAINERETSNHSTAMLEQRVVALPQLVNHLKLMLAGTDGLAQRVGAHPLELR